MSPARADHSRLVQRVRRRHGARLGALPAGPLDAPAIEALIDALLSVDPNLAAALRVARALVMEHVAVRDVAGAASLDEVCATMTALAEVALERALAAALAELAPHHGVPRNAAGQPIALFIVGMGKLGARELNVSSDIDLIYIHEEEGDSDGPLPLSASEYFARVAKRLYALVGEATDDGFVFRMDLALRPHGKSGPPTLSLSGLEAYLLAHGREWERLAWLKSRVVAPRAAVASGQALALRALVTPFVYRRYLDYGVFDALRQLHRQVRDDAERRALGRPERAHDVKLARGGIREIEFTVQLLQVVRGGQYPEIRTRRTVRALARLAQAGLMAPAVASALTDTYIWLRQVEHRIQYLDDQQTHTLPSVPADLAWIAASLPLPLDSADALLTEWARRREAVALEFDSLLRGGPVSAPASAAAHSEALDGAGLTAGWPTALAERVHAFTASPRVQALREPAQARLARLLRAVGSLMAADQCSTDAAAHFIDWLEPLLRRDSYLALLAERPSVLARLLRLLGLARWPMRYLMQHPGVIDELADERLLAERFDAATYTSDLDERHTAWVRAGEADEGQLIDTLRRAHHAEVFRTLVRDVEGRIGVEQVADDLSALADATLACAVRWAWAHFKQRHRSEPQLAVIAYGKLGGLELGYGSDLDVVFVYDEQGEADPQEAQEVYARFVRKLMGWLTLRTAAGALFEIDTALRPNGNSGLLVTAMAAFENYQRGRGSNTAWTWEHQAITRARCATGPAALRQRFDAVRRDVITAPRDAAALASEVRAMRAKVAAAHPVRGALFDVKHSPGGMMDAEFAVQYLVLAHGRDHPALQDNAGNTALLLRAQAAGLLPPGTGSAAADAYRALRQAQHRARLDEQPTQVDPAGWQGRRGAIDAVWAAVLGAAPDTADLIPSCVAPEPRTFSARLGLPNPRLRR